MTPLSIGIVGAGEITRRVHLPVLSNIPDVRIAWLYDRRPDASQSLAKSYGLTALHSIAAQALPPCDIALLAIPVDGRAEYLQRFATRGTAVFCEKPFARSAAEHSRFAAEFSPHELACGYMRRFFRSALLLRRIVAEGMFGQLESIDISEGNRSQGSGVDASFLDDPRLGAARGVLTDLGSHTIDMALYLTAAGGFEVQSCVRVLDDGVDRKVTALVKLLPTPESRPAGTLSPAASSAASLIPGHGGAGSVRGAVDLNYGVSWLDAQENRVRLNFPTTSVWSDLGVDATVYCGDPRRPQAGIALSSGDTGATTYNQAFYLEWRNFLDSFRARRESLISARSALLTTTLVEALLNAPAPRASAAKSDAAA
jgi:predicted dehydrogenase